MKIKVDKYQFKHGHDYCEISLINQNDVEIKLLNYGATLEKILVPTDTKTKHNLIMSLSKPEDYSQERNFLGGTVGRIIGRMKDGKWKFNDQVNQFILNDGPNHAHGGIEGLDTQVFAFTTKQTDSQVSVCFTLLDPAEHNGYPGNLKTKVTYTLDNYDTLTYQIEAITDVPTLCNPANHVYFNFGLADESIKDHVLTLDADYYLPLNSNSIPTTGRQSVAGTIFDLRKGIRLGDVIGSTDEQIASQNGLNHPFMLNGRTVAAQLMLPGTSYRMNLQTTAPAVVVYTGNHFNHEGYAQNLGRYAGVALETQEPPSADETLQTIVLLPGETFKRQTSWHFEY